MLKKMRGIWGALLVSMLAGAACSDDTPEDDGKDNQAGEGGGGSLASAGRGGKTSAGSSGRAGSTAASGAGGQSEEGGAGPSCPGCSSGLCLEDGTCVDCLPNNDQCPQGQYCTDANECAPGCKDDTMSCASGKCDVDRNCEQCIDDGECIGEDVVCNEGTCGPACTAQQEGQSAGCEVGLTCCSLHCIQIETNANHCGACGAFCADGQFCGNTSCAGGGEGGAGGAGSACVQCYDTMLANLCAIGRVVVILDSTENASDGNRKPGREIGAAIGTSCATSPTVIEEEQDSEAALNFATGRPVAGGGELLLVAGGTFFQNLEDYVETQRISPLYLFSDPASDVQEFRRSSDDEPVVSRMISSDNESHDFFIVQFMRDAASGSLVLNVQGFWLSGTTAASLLMTTEVIPNLASYDKAWYAYEWTDGDGDKLPTLDEIDEVASGS